MSGSEGDGQVAGATQVTDAASEPLLEIDGLRKYFYQNTRFIDWILRTETVPVRAIDGISFDVAHNEVVGIIGESGCGKSTLLRAIIGLHSITDGEIRYRGRPTSEFTKRGWREYRSNVQMVFQNPYNSLNPIMTVDEILKEPLDIHGLPNKDERVHEKLEEVELSPPERYIDKRPDELSGGEKQRVSIARCLILEPKLILADEPVSMLDVSTQTAILNLLSNLVDEKDLAMCYISHDLSTVSYVCDRINVMYQGKIVESGPTRELLSDPKHPYTQALVNAVPIPDPDHKRERTVLKGSTEQVTEAIQGCIFQNRCPEVMDICKHPPRYVEVGEHQQVACHLYYDHDLESRAEVGSESEVADHD